MKLSLQNILSGILGLLLIVFGLNKFLGFIPVEPPADPTAQQFMGMMFGSYLFAAVAITEIIGGILIAIPKTRFTGWLLLLPVIFNIVAFHIAHDFIGNGIWLLPTILFVIIGFDRRKHIQKLMES